MFHTFLKIRLLMGLAPALGAVLYFGTGSSGEYYDRTPAQIVTALENAHLPVHILGGAIVDSQVHSKGDGTVITALIGQDGREAMHFITTIDASGNGANVSTTVAPPGGDLKSKANEALAAQPYAAQLLGLLAKEHVDAAIDGRPFDMLFATNPMARKMLDEQAGMREHIDDINAANSQMDEWDIDAFRSNRSGDSTSYASDDWGSDSASRSDGWGD